jgi:hypothetical protein
VNDPRSENSGGIRLTGGNLSRPFAAISAALLVLLAPAASPQTAPPGRGLTIRLTIAKSVTNTPLADFPVPVKLSASSGIGGRNVSAVFDELSRAEDRKKLSVVTPGGVECPVEIASWNPEKKTAELWVKVPLISPTEDTVLLLRCDRARVDNSSHVGDTGSAPAEAVWSNHYVAVWHMNDGPGGRILDSTANHHHGTKQGNPVEAEGITGVCQRFDGVDDFILVPDDDAFSQPTTGGLTVSFLLSAAVLDMTTSSSGYIHYLGKGEPGSYEWAFRYYNRNAPNGGRPQRLSVYHWQPSGGLGSGSYTEEPFEAGEWVHLTGEFDSTRSYMFRNGILHDYGAEPQLYASYSVVPTNGPAPVRIGTREGGTFWNGRLDEVQISNVTRPSAWNKATSAALKDSLITFAP